MELGICTGVENARIIADAGADYVEANAQRLLVPRESDEAFAAGLAAVKGAPLPVRAANCFLPGDLKSTGPDFDRDGIIAWATTAFARAAKVGIKHIVFGSSGSRKLPDGFDRAQGVDQFIDLLARLGPVAAEHDVTLVIEPLREAEDNFINTVAEGAEFVQAVDHPNIRLLADIYHMLENGESPEDLAEHGEWIQHVHAADAGTRHFPSGECDLRPFFRALREVGYAGRLSIEGKPPRGLETDAGPAIAELRRQLTDAGM